MLTDAYLFNGTPMVVPLIDRCTIPRMLAFLCTGNQERSALTYYQVGKLQYRLSYAQLISEVIRVRHALQDAYGIKKGDRVATVCRNCPEVVILNLAALSVGAIVVPLNPEESLEVIEYILKDSGARIMFYSRSLNSLETLALKSEHLCYIQAIEEICQPVRPGVSELSSIDWEIDLPHTSPAVLLYTSGTTALPKGVMLSHYNLMINAEGLFRVHRLDINKTHMCVLPLFHANAWGFSMIASYYAGIHLVLNDTFPTFSIWEILRNERVNICSVVPEMLRCLCLRACRAETLPNFRYFVSAAAPLSVDIAKRFYEKTGIFIHQGYGLSECTNFATTIPYAIKNEEYHAVMHDQDVPSIGIPLYGCDLMVVDTDGKEVPPGVLGEIVIKGHNNMLGYWRDLKATEAALGSGYLRTDDQGYYLVRGDRTYFFITGRFKEVILRAGENISPAKIEDELAWLREFGEFAVVGFRHHQVGEEVGLYIYSTEVDSVQTQVIAGLARIPFFRCPKVIVISTSPIPRTSTGKIKRKLLISNFQDFHSNIFVQGQPLIIKKGTEDASYT